MTERRLVLRRAIVLAAVLAGVWLLWSGHYETWMLLLGALSTVSVVGLFWGMGAIDQESVPVELGILPFLTYAPWLLKEIAQANVDVTRRILAPSLPIRPSLVTVESLAWTPVGRVVFANSITLTPGTVSVDLEGRRVRVHALTIEGAIEDLAGEMNRRVARLERPLHRHRESGRSSPQRRVAEVSGGEVLR